MSSSTQQSSAQNRPAFTTQALVTMAIFAAILCISAFTSVLPLPLPGSPHITLLNFVILLIALLFPLQQSFLIVLVWMLLGCVSLPVFIGGGAGIGYLTGPWGGYTFSFLIVALLLPAIRGSRYNRIRYTIVSIIGALLVDFVGMFWLMYMNKLGIAEAFSIGFVPFLPLDMVKAVVAARDYSCIFQNHPPVNLKQRFFIAKRVRF